MYFLFRIKILIGNPCAGSSFEVVHTRCTPATIKFLFGLQNGATSHFLAVVQAQKVKSLFSLTTTFLSKFFDYIRTQMADSLSVTLKLKGDASPWLLCTLQTKMSPVSDFQCDDLIIGGDFNLILDLDKDKKGGRYKTHTRSVKALKEFIAKLDLIDAWRVLNPNTLRYTWRRKKPEIQCRLDFFLVSQSLMCNVTHAGITTGLKTDHFLITIRAALHCNQRGPGYWKLKGAFTRHSFWVRHSKILARGPIGLGTVRLIYTTKYVRVFSVLISRTAPLKQERHS